MDAKILDILRTAGPLLATEIAARTGFGEHDVDRRLRMMYGTRVTTDGHVWRLLAAGPALPYLTQSTEALADGLRRQGA